VIVTGMISAETVNTVTIRRADGMSETVQRVNVASLRSTGPSAMPEGLEDKLDLRAMADLLAYLNSIKWGSPGLSTVPHDPDLHAGLGAGDQVFAGQGPAQPLVEPLRSGERRRVDGDRRPRVIGNSSARSAAGQPGVDSPENTRS
jgi:hypothetical protein